jgi:hypothetical protein
MQLYLGELHPPPPPPPPSLLLLLLLLSCAGTVILAELTPTPTHFTHVTCAVLILLEIQEAICVAIVATTTFARDALLPLSRQHQRLLPKSLYNLGVQNHQKIRERTAPLCLNALHVAQRLILLVSGSSFPAAARQIFVKIAFGFV